MTRDVREWSADERADILRRWNNGQSAGIIGDHFGVNRDRILGVVRRAKANGLPVRDAPPADRKDPNPGRPRKPDALKGRNRPCGGCSALIDRRNATGFCRECLVKNGGMKHAMVNAKAMKPCVDCGSPCKDTRGNGRCYACREAEHKREQRAAWVRNCPSCGAGIAAARELCVSCGAAETHRRKVEAAADWPSGRRRECPLADLSARKVEALLPITRALSWSDDEARLMAAFAVVGAIRIEGV